MKNYLSFDLGNGLVYNTPPIPKNETEILYYDLPKEQQYWRTEYDKKNSLYIPTDKELKKLSEKERLEFINMWRYRWVNGMWFFNNGEPTYLNGLCIDHLVFNKFNNRYQSYIESQRDDFYFRELVLDNDDWLGMQWIKPRRYGMTDEEITTAIHVLISGEYHNIAVMSDTQDKARTTILTKLIDTYIGRPSFMREEFYKSNGKTPIKELKLKNVVTKDDEDVWLGGIVTAYPTNEKALDGKEFMYVIMDEMSKIANGVSPLQMLAINLKTVRNYGRIGKVSCLSTTGDNDNVVESVHEWITLAAKSKYNPYTGKSESGLIKRFVSGIYSLWLEKEFLPDKYGKVDIQKNTEEVLRLHNLHQKNSKEYYFEQRRLPLEESHALTTASDNNYFRKVALVERRKYLEGLPISEKPYVRGNLIEKTVDNGIVKVYFEEAEDGIWLVAVHPLVDIERGIDCRNRFKYSERNVYYPVVNPEFVIGYDPVRYDKETIKSNHTSKASIIVHKKYDYFNKPNSKNYCADVKAALCFYRPERAEDAHHEFCKAMKYWGAIGGFERQVDSVKKYVDSQNMLPMVVIDEKGIHGIWTNTKIIDDGLSKLVSRYAPPKEQNQKDHIEIYPFEDGLINLEDFDRLNTTKYDIVMSEIILEHTLPHVEYTNVTSEKNQNIVEFLREITPLRN